MKIQDVVAKLFERVTGAAGAALCGALLALLAGAPASAQTPVPPIVWPYWMSTIAGTGSNGTPTSGALATATALSGDLRAVAVDGQGNIFVLDTGDSRVLEINGSSGILTVVAGGASKVCSAAISKQGDGCPASQTILSTPRGIALDQAGNIYIAGYNDSCVHEINRQTGIMTLIAGSLPNKTSLGTKGYTGDGGQAVGAALNAPRGVRVDNSGNIWIADTGNNVVRKVNASTGIITTVVGFYPGSNKAATGGWAGDGSQANSSAVLLNEPLDVVFDSANNAYVADFNNGAIREVTASTGVINTIIGTGTSATATTPESSFPVSAKSLILGKPTKIAIDAYGNLYLVDSTESVVYFYDAVTKYVSLLAGEYAYAGTAGSGFTVCNNNPQGDGCRPRRLSSTKAPPRSALRSMQIITFTSPTQAIFASERPPATWTSPLGPLASR